MPPTAMGPKVYTGSLAPQARPTGLKSYLRAIAPWKHTAKAVPMNGPPLAASELLPPVKRAAEQPTHSAKKPRVTPFSSTVVNPIRPSLAPPVSLGTILRMNTTAPPPAPAVQVPTTVSDPIPVDDVLEVTEGPPLADVSKLPLSNKADAPPDEPATPSSVFKFLKHVSKFLLTALPLPAAKDKESATSSDDVVVKKPIATPKVEIAPPVVVKQDIAPVIEIIDDAEPTMKGQDDRATSSSASGHSKSQKSSSSDTFQFTAPPAKLKADKGKSTVATKAGKSSGDAVSKKKLPAAFPKPKAGSQKSSRRARKEKEAAERKAGFVPIDSCAIIAPEISDDPNGVDPATGIRYSFLRILFAEDPDTKTEPPKKYKYVNPLEVHKPPSHRPDPKDRLFPRPLVQAESLFKKRDRKSILTRFLTVADCLKLEKFHITWDCTMCLRTFLDKEALAAHKPHCKEQRCPEGGPKCFACQFCKRGFPNESVLLSHKQHNHGDLKEVKEEVRTEELRQDIEKIQIWVDKCTITTNQVENCMNTLHQLYEMLTTMKVYLASDVAATKQLAGREMMVMIDIAVKASALGCSTSAVSVADITNANPTVVAGLFHAIAHLEGFGLLPGALRRRVDDTRRKRNIVFHTLGVVLDEVALERQCALAIDVLRWAQVLMDRTLNVVINPRRDIWEDDEECIAPRREFAMDVESGPRPYSPTLAAPASLDTLTVADAKPGAVPAPTLPVGVANLGNQSGIPAWKYTAPAIPILNKASVLLGAPPTS